MREYAETTQQYIDEEITRIINERYDAVVKLLTEKKHLLEYIAQRLLEKEIIDKDEFAEIIQAEGRLLQQKDSDAPSAGAETAAGTGADPQPENNA